MQYQSNNFDALHGLGQIAYQRGRLDSALALIQAALKTDLSRADGFASLGLVFHALRDFQRRPLASYDEGLRIAPDDAELLNRRGVARWSFAVRAKRWKPLIVRSCPRLTTAMRKAIAPTRC